MSREVKRTGCVGDGAEGDCLSVFGKAILRKGDRTARGPTPILGRRPHHAENQKVPRGRGQGTNSRDPFHRPKGHHTGRQSLSQVLMSSLSKIADRMYVCIIESIRTRVLPFHTTWTTSKGGGGVAKVGLRFFW